MPASVESGAAILAVEALLEPLAAEEVALLAPTACNGS